jgi:hypothetical protein
MSLRHVNVRLPKIELHCMQISSYSLAETALVLAEISKKSMAAGFAASPKGTYTSHAAQQRMPAD